jgi:hypothetical protein
VPTSYLAAVLAVALAVGGIAILGQRDPSGVVNPSPSASPRPSPDPRNLPSFAAFPIPALTETFVSPRNGISIGYASTWTVRPATVSWPPNVYLPFGNPALDQLQRLGDVGVLVASQRLARGQTEAQWLASFFVPYPTASPCAIAPIDSPRIEIDGRMGYLDMAGCPTPADSAFSVPDVQYEAFVFAAGRVYQIGLHGRVDRPYFDAIVATIHLDPASALDP